jgi:hypothetical protein
MKTSKLLTVIIVLQSLLVAALWTSPANSANVARADINIPNPGERQIAMLDELKGINAKMDKVLGVLQGGDLQVKVAKQDDSK